MSPAIRQLIYPAVNSSQGGWTRRGNLRDTLQSSIQTAGGGRRLSALSDAEADCIKLSEREVMESEPPARSDAGRDFA